MLYFRGSAAAIRLRSRMTELVSSKDTRINREHVTKNILELFVGHKIRNKASRPFFSVKRLDLIEEELGGGIYSNRSYKCDERQQVNLLKCSGCRRKWCCGQDCSKQSWSQHKHDCDSKWRTK